MATTPEKPAHSATESVGDILGRIIRREGLGKRQLKGRRLASQVLARMLGPDLAPRADVVSVKKGVVTIEADSSSLFQELEGFHRERLLAGFREAGLQVGELRVRLKK